MKDKSNMYKAGLRKKIYLIVFLMLAVGGAVVCAAVAAERSGMYWIGLGGEVSAENPEDNKGFFTVDVSDFLTPPELAEAKPRTRAPSSSLSR